MPGAWEVLSNPSMVLGVLHVDTTTVAWAMGLRALQLTGPVIPVAGMPYDMARNSVVMRALEMGASFCAFLDSDVIPPPDAFLRLMRHNLPMVSGVYFRRSPPHGAPVAIKNGTWLNPLPRNQLVEVDLVGAGCLCLRTDFLRSIPPHRKGHHWFDWCVNLRGTGVVPEDECLSEDFTFNVHARKHGVKTFLDTSIICKHVGYAEAGHGTLLPLETPAA